MPTYDDFVRLTNDEAKRRGLAESSIKVFGELRFVNHTAKIRYVVYGFTFWDKNGNPIPDWEPEFEIDRAGDGYDTIM